MASGKDRDQIDAHMVLMVEATVEEKQRVERLVRRRDAAAGVAGVDTVELLSMLGVGEEAA